MVRNNEGLLYYKKENEQNVEYSATATEKEQILKSARVNTRETGKSGILS